MATQKKVKWLIAIDAILLVLLIGELLLSLYLRERELVPPEVSIVTPVLYHDGVAYTKRTDRTTVCLIGVDSEGAMASSGTYTNPARCDFVALLILDRKGTTADLLLINRDTMADVPRIGISGTGAPARMQLALAHTYGDGMEESSENVCAAVEELTGVSPDRYFTMNMTGLAALVDAVGGVEATVYGDFTAYDSALADGATLKMSGTQCVLYLRGRQGIGEETNTERAERQRRFIEALLPQLSAYTGLDAAVTEIADYVVTDMNLSLLRRTVRSLTEVDSLRLHTVPGESRMGETYIEFHADSEALTSLVISLLYERAEETP